MLEISGALTITWSAGAEFRALTGAGRWPSSTTVKTTIVIATPVPAISIDGRAVRGAALVSSVPHPAQKRPPLTEGVPQRRQRTLNGDPHSEQNSPLAVAPHEAHLGESDGGVRIPERRSILRAETQTAHVYAAREHRLFLPSDSAHAMRT